MLLLEVLTPRQLDVLKHLMRGLSNQEIAERLHIGEKSVKGHLTKLMKAYDVTSRTRLIVKVADLKQEDMCSSLP